MNSLVIVGEITLTTLPDQLEPGFLRYCGNTGKGRRGKNARRLVFAL